MEHCSVYTERCSVCKGAAMRHKTKARKRTTKPKPNDPNKVVRADAQRNLEGILRTALEVFETSGVDAPVREIADKAGVGVATLYRHFPNRSDLIAAVFRHQIDACADAASTLA